MALFSAVADEYDTGRPSYPPDVIAALGPIAGLRVLDVGAGTGLATRLLLARGAVVAAIDVEPRLLARAVAHTPSLSAVLADGAVLPIRSASIDVACFAQSWHWLDPQRRTTEVGRVLRPGGRWAGWWSHARGDRQDWFDSYWAVIEAACPGTHRSQRDTDWGATLADDPAFIVADRIVVPWRRTVAIDEWMLDQASHSYIAALDADARTATLAALRRILTRHFGAHDVDVAYETWLWTATRSVG